MSKLKTHNFCTFLSSVLEDNLGISVLVPFSQINGFKFLYTYNVTYMYTLVVFLHF